MYRDGSTEPWVVDILCALVRAIKPTTIVETGTYKAMTTIKLIEAAESYQDEHDCRIYTIESDLERARAAETLLRTQDRGYATVVVGMAEQVLAGMDMGVVDFIFLDDDHTAAHVREEIRLALKILRPGGIVCGHDVVGHFGLGDVFKEYGGVVLDLPRLHLAGGLGIVVK